MSHNEFDVVVVGAGPTGIAFACGFANTKLKIAIVDKLPKKILSNPNIDGREIAITHRSVKILKDLKVWHLISAKFISPIKEARVLDGNSPYFLNFDHNEIQKETLGFLIPNYLIRKALYKRVINIPNVTIIDKTECVSLESNKLYSSILLSNGKKIKTSLIVASDSRFSKMRTKMGISAFIRDFDKNMVICRMKHKIPHNNVAYEFFRYFQTQASLPYINNQSSIITTVPRSRSSELIKMNTKQFNKEIQNNFKNFFGKMELVGKRYSYPMITAYSKRFIANRFALIGDSAVGMHPVTAHGFNLNLRGLEILINEIKLSVKNKIDIGLFSNLYNYQSKLRRIATPLYLTTNSIVNLYTNSSLPAKITRPFLLRFANTVRPIKQTFLRVLE